MLIISNDDVARVLTIADTIERLRGVYEELARGDAVCRPRIDIRLPTGQGDEIYQWGTMEGASVGSGYFAIRMKSDIVEEVEYGGTRTQEKYCVEPGRFCGLVMLFSIRNAEPLALINDGIMQHMRVSADSAIGASELGRPSSRVVGMIGSGGMARGHLEALLQALPIEAVQVFSPTRANRQRYAVEMKERFGVEAVATDDPESACRGADLVCGCTDAVGEVIRSDWVGPGTHVTCIGGRVDDALRSKVDVWLRLGNTPAPLDEPGWHTESEHVGYVAQPANSVWDRRLSGAPRRPPSDANRAKVVSLKELRDGTHPGRTSDRQVTYSERGNVQGVQFFALAGHVYERALAEGFGRQIPTDWLLQDIRD